MTLRTRPRMDPIRARTLLSMTPHDRMRAISPDELASLLRAYLVLDEVNRISYAHVAVETRR